MSIQDLLRELHNWQWLGAFFARVSVGLLFFLSGSGKLFAVERRRQMRATLEEAHVPLAGATAWFVSGVECVFGLLLLLGALTPLACLMLAGVMAVALATIRIPQIQGSGPFAWLAEFFYLPEVLYLLILFWISLAGPGWLSVDNLLFWSRRS
jgi:putative oxidoreductase